MPQVNISVMAASTTLFERTFSPESGLVPLFAKVAAMRERCSTRTPTEQHCR